MSRKRFSRHDITDLLKELEKAQDMLANYRYLDAMEHLKALNRYMRWLLKYRRF